ncbi:MAG TPA: HAD family hydrolase [Candidatus Saccharimonadales bacterium]|nr:HAD family hydrolase [Candidatus Saccharimonadales bacterium]
MNTLKCPKLHVITGDLDDTLVATQNQPERLRRESDEALLQIGQLVTDLRTQSKAYFGSATGRSFASIQELAAERPAFKQMLPIMDFHIASVGTAIYARQKGATDFTHVPGWPRVGLWDRGAIAIILSTHPDLTAQEPAAQGEYKISYRTESREETSLHASRLRWYLGQTASQAEIIVSGHHPWRFVDVLPAGIHKGSALLQLPQLLESDSGHTDIVVPEYSICRVAGGDSMNDQALLAAADVAIIPSNAQPDLRNWAENTPLVGSLYTAEGHCAVGFLQGLRQHLYGS